ncbi:MAG: ribosome biogenesis GTPase Der [Candidatus Omnitrophota bacterium]|nr:MAG: ribosome biogenesis GTPase Der [Candidatus Omnitrophota bacterium]
MNPDKVSSVPVIAIVGSPNAGKSSLFNRLTGKRKAIVEPTPGVTRNRLSADLSIHGKNVKVIDTGGIKARLKEKIDQLVYQQVELSLDEADIILFVTDVRTGATPIDYHITSLLRKSSKKVFLLVNKVDNKRLEEGVYDFYQLGLGEPYPISALQGYGLELLLEDISKSLFVHKKEYPEEERLPKEEITAAIVGRPNVGKSTFINALFKKDVVIVDETPGTTRDAVDVHFEYADKAFILVDTAGIKHKRKLRKPVEIFSIARSKESIRRAEVALVMLDAAEGLCADDIKIIEYVIKCGKPCAIIVNKWDLAKGSKHSDYETALKERLKLLEWIPILFISCLKGKNLLNVIELASMLKRRANISIRTAELNRLLKDIQSAKRHPLVENKKINIFYGTQTQIAPPAFTLFSNYPKLIKSDYLNFLENNIRSQFGLFGVPIRFKLRER